MKILVGVGPDASTWKAKGWYCNDVEPFPGVDAVGPCWNLPLADGCADEILAKGMFEHLTYAQAAASLVEWRRVLKFGGRLDVEAPDADEYLRQYIALRDDPSAPEGSTSEPGEPEDFAVCQGPERWLRRALWGWQRWPGDEHRSGWTEHLLGFYLRKHFGEAFEIRRMAISFDEDVPASRVRHLWARAVKADPSFKRGFEVRPPFVIFHDNKGGLHATMFAANGQRLAFRSDASVFNDAKSQFSWAFEGRVQAGDTVVFATADREVVGKVLADGRVQLANKEGDGGVFRLDDKPIDLAGSLLPTVEALLAPPHPQSLPRPVELRRR